MNWLLNAIGSIGFILFATACVPMAWKTMRSGEAVVKDRSTIWTFVAATGLVTIYLFGLAGFNFPTFLSLVEVICWGIVARYSYFPRLSGRTINVGYCTRDEGHEGPCNGWPRHTCAGFVGFERGPGYRNFNLDGSIRDQGHIKRLP